MAWLVAYSNLTDEQIQAVEAPMSSPRFIVGAPGSGKSLVLVHRAAHLRAKHKVKPSRYRVLVFTNVLKEYIRSACLELSLDDESISTFDHWCAEYHKTYIGKQPWNEQNKRPDFDATKRAVLAHARTLKDKMLDFVLVDEGQDLNQMAYEILDAVATHITVCADYKQQIYDHGTSEPDIARHLGLNDANFNLLSAFRCSPELVPLAATFIEDTEERCLFTEQSRIWGGVKETPLLFLAKDFYSEKVRLAEIVRERLNANERIAILFPQIRQVAGFAQGLMELGIDVESQKASRWNSLLELDFNSPNPKVMTYHSVKGLTFDSVLMPRLVEGSFSNASPATRKRLIFVGITRAANWVYLSAVESNQLQLLVDLETKADTDVIEIQRTSTKDRSKKETIDENAAADPTLDDLI